MVKRIKKRIPREDGEIVEVEVEEAEDAPQGAPTVEELGIDPNARRESDVPDNDKLGEVPEKGWDKVMDTNLKGLFFLTQALLPQLEAAGTAADPARIINIGSIDGIQVSLFDAIGYGASKAGLHHMTQTMANRLAARHITANAIAPGGFETDMLAPMMATIGDQIVGGVPLGRIGRAEDIAGVAVMLASRAGAYVTGAIIPVDGGVLTL